MINKIKDQGLYETIIGLVPAADFDKDPVSAIGKAVLCLIADDKHDDVPKVVEVLCVEQVGDVKYNVQGELAKACDKRHDEAFQKLTKGYFIVKDRHLELERAVCV